MNSLARWSIGLRSLARAALRHDFVEGLITAQDTLGAVAFERLAERMAASPEGLALLRGGPHRCALGHVEGMAHLPPDTFGGALWRHLERHGFLREPDIPESRCAEGHDARCAKDRWRQTHDARHVLTGLAPSVPDESLLHAFQLGQHFNPFSLILMLSGPLYGWRDQSPLVTWSRAPEAYRAGKAARLTAAFAYEHHMTERLDDVRKRLNLRSLEHLSCLRPPPVPERTGRELVRATYPYAREQRMRTWWELASTIVPYVMGWALAVLAPAWPLQLVGSVLLALSTVRLFAFLHDMEHGALFRGSRAGAIVVEAIGVLTCIPPRVWRAFHNRHHGTAAIALPIDQADLRGGDFINRIVSASAWSQWSAARRRTYRFVRSPITIVMGWLVNHVLGACVTQLVRDPIVNRSAAFTLAAHLTWLGAMAWFFGPQVFCFLGVVPAALAAAIGTWIIYVQHSFPGVEYQEGTAWDPVAAAMRGSSFLDLGRVLRWFTGNIGYHHVHHINPRIPFYRLPEVMEAIPELRNATRITWRDTAACLRIHAWDGERRVAGPLPG